ncbi:MAG: Sir2 family NAD-dependent protein deacetylase [Pseudomonadota bacterium]
MPELRSLPEGLGKQLRSFLKSNGHLVVLTGAGISAESGIPTFRGKEGYWTIGSAEYQPEEMATHWMFERNPEDVWIWYLYRRGICRSAKPNAGHIATVAMEKALGNRFLLITQNVDGLHLRAGNSMERTYQIHGNIDFARCDNNCGKPRWLLSNELGGKKKGESLTDRERELLRCPECGGWARPHVLWFDECYDDENFHFQASLKAASTAKVLLVVGTSGATNLPMQVGTSAMRAGCIVVDINPEPNPFSRLAETAQCGFFLESTAGPILTAIAKVLMG